MAEGIMASAAERHGFSWEVDSAGTSNWHEGEPPHRLAIQVAKNHQIDISGQRSRPFLPEDMQLFDHIYVMDSQNYVDVKGIAGKLWDADKVDLILNGSGPGKNASVPDPWYDNTEKSFEKVFELLTDACEAIIKENQSS